MSDEKKKNEKLVLKRSVMKEETPAYDTMLGNGQDGVKDHVFVVKEIGDQEVLKDEVYTSNFELLKKFIMNTTEPVEIYFYSNGCLLKTITRRAELDKEDMIFLLSSWTLNF
ncbi:hypothetical protein ACYSNW_02660 [Enterococcus sp. LJL99]